MDDRDLQAPFRAMADSVPVLIWITGPDGECTFVNARWLEFTGRHLDQELGSGWADSVHPDDLDRWVTEHRGATARREQFEIEYRLRRADGAWRWILARAVPSIDEDGRFRGLIGSGIDLTERREVDLALEQSRTQLAAAMAAGHMGTFDLDLASGVIARDHSLEELYGLAPGEASTIDTWATLIHPDDRASVLGEVARVTAEGGEYTIEHRLVRTDREVRWVERRGHTYSDAHGKVVGLRGVVVDVTDRKGSEEERSVLLERVTRLQSVTASLARAGTPDRVLGTMVDEGVPATGASAGSVAVLDAGGARLDVAAAVGYPPSLIERFRHLDLTVSVPLADAARTAAPVLCRDLGEWGRRYPDLAGQAGDVGHRAAAAFPLLVDERVIGAVALSFDQPQRFDCAQIRFLSAVVGQCAQALDRTWAYAAQAEARQAAEAASARLSLLADASILLAGSLEYESTVPDVARLTVPLLCDGLVVDLTGDGDGGWMRLAAEAADDALRAGLLALPQLTVTEAGAAALHGLGLGSVVVVPLEARGRPVGVLALARHDPDSLVDADRSLAAELGARVAQSVDTARLYRAERRAHEDAERAARQLRFLLDVSTVVAAPLEPGERMTQLARHATGAVCDLCLIDLVDRDGSLRRVAAVAADPELQPAADALQRLMHPDPGSPHPSAAAIRSGRTEHCSEVTDERLQSIASSGTHLEVARQVQPLSYLSVPLVGLSGILGAITLITTVTSGRHYGAEDRVLAEDMAKRVAMGLERASMHEEMRRVAQTLQASLLPSVPPAIPGLEVGTRYLAAEAGAVVGGDFYDVFALGPGAWAVVVGDVCGQGVEAATVTGLARHTVRSSALDHPSPSIVLSHLNDVLLGVTPDPAGQADPRFCTVCLVRLELTPRGASATLAMGGHPLPYVLGADGQVRQVGRPGSLLGVLPAPEILDDDVELGAGEALVLYTDGITERHRGQLFFGDGELARTLVACAGLTADEIAGRVEDAARRFVDGQPSDDMAVVVVRVPPR